MDAGTGRVQDDDVRMPVFPDKPLIQNVFHVAGIEGAVGDAIGLGIGLGVFDGFGDVFNAHHLGGLATDELRNGAGSGIEVIDRFFAR